MSRLVLHTAPSAAPITVSEAKAHIRLASGITADDDDVGAYIDAATALLEGYTSRAFVSRTYDLTLDGPDDDGALVLYRMPIVSVTSIVTFDEDDAETVVDAATVYRLSRAQGRVVLRRGAVWPRYPEVRDIDGYRVRYVAGYGDAEDVPEPIVQAIKMQVAEWYENRGDDPEMGVGATATQGVQLALGEASKSVVRAAGLRRIIV